MTRTFTIVEAKHDQAGEVAAVIGEAFQHLEVAHWLIDTPTDRAAVLTANMTIFVEHALTGAGTVTMTDDGSAVAVWFPHDPEPPAPPPDYDRQLEQACGRHTGQFRILDRYFEINHPHGKPHHHLAFMAVLPSAQGEGRGSALLVDHHARHPETPGYLEASCPQSRALYERHGYANLGDPFVLPGGPPMWPMWRRATL